MNNNNNNNNNNNRNNNRNNNINNNNRNSNNRNSNNRNSNKNNSRNNKSYNKSYNNSYNKSYNNSYNKSYSSSNNNSNTNSNDENKIKVLFVCLGNICRSPMAEAVFTYEVAKRQLSDKFIIDSCGTSGYHTGKLPDSRTRAVCKQNNVPVNHRARRIRNEDYFKYDYILCMDYKNLDNLLRIAPNKPKAKVQLFGEYDPDEETIIRDPYFSKGLGAFNHNFEQVTRCSVGLLDHLGFLD